MSKNRMRKSVMDANESADESHWKAIEELYAKKIPGDLGSLEEKLSFHVNSIGNVFSAWLPFVRAAKDGQSGDISFCEFRESELYHLTLMCTRYIKRELMSQSDILPSHLIQLKKAASCCDCVLSNSAAKPANQSAINTIELLYLLIHTMTRYLQLVTQHCYELGIVERTLTSLNVKVNDDSSYLSQILDSIESELKK